MSWFDELSTPRINLDDFEKPMASGLESLASAREALHTARLMERGTDIHDIISESSSEEDLSDDEYYTADFTEDSQPNWGWEDSRHDSQYLASQQNRKSLNDNTNSIQNDKNIDLRLSSLLENRGPTITTQQNTQQKTTTNIFKERIALEPKLSNVLDSNIDTITPRKPQLGELRVVPKKSKASLKRGNQKGHGFNGGLDAPSSAALLLSESLPARPIFDPLETSKPPPQQQQRSRTKSKSTTSSSKSKSKSSKVPIAVPKLEISSAYGWGNNDDESDSDESIGSVSSTRSTASTASSRSRIMSARAYATMARIEGNQSYRVSSKSAPAEATFAFPMDKPTENSTKQSKGKSSQRKAQERKTIW